MDQINGPGSLGRLLSANMAEITLEKISDVGFQNARANAPWINKGKSILTLQDTPLMEGKDALVIAAGPSLHRRDAASLIRASDFKGTMVVTDSAMYWCLRQNIIPDLVVTLDPHPRRIVRWFGDPNLREADVACDDYFARQDMDPGFRQNELRANREVVELINKYGTRIRIALASSASESVVRRVFESGMDVYWWNPMYDDYDNANSLTRQIHEFNGLPCVNTGGNVGSACWVFAHAVLRKRRIGLLGMDFGYYTDTPYPRTQYYKEILQLVGPERLDQVFVHIRNPHLDKVFYTDPAYLWYRDSFLEMAQLVDCDTYNCTGGGILFGPRLKWMTIDEFLLMPRE